MRAFILFSASLFIIALGASNNYPDYANPGSGALNQGTCAAVLSNAAYQESPIDIQTSLCGSYNTFSLSLTDVKGIAPHEDDPRGSFALNYTGGKLQVNGLSYTSNILTFRSQAEHSLQGNNPALEMQIEMTNDQGGVPAVLSFLFADIGDDANNVAMRGQYLVYNASGPVIESLSSTNWTLNLNQVGQRIMAKPSQYQYLNFYTYNGTFTYPPCSPANWYIYGTELLATTTVITSFSQLIQNAANITNGTSPNLNNRPFSGAGGGNGAQTVQRLCYSGYFTVTIGHTYALWFGVAIIVIFFIITLGVGEKPIKDPNYEETAWTNHPLISLFSFGNELHTRKTRAALVLVAISLNAMFSALWYDQSAVKTRTSNIILYAIYSALISFFIVFLVGNVLRLYYLAKYEFHRTNDEAWDQRAQNRIFAYYTIVFAIIIVSWPVTVWKMNDLHEEISADASNLWVATFFIGIALEILILYPFECLLASSIGVFKDLAKRRGFMYDEICHETYLAYVKAN